MTDQKDYDGLAEQLYTRAVRDFEQTGRYKLLQEKLEQMENTCGTMFTTDEKEFAFECFALLKDVFSQQEHYVYRRGLLDCVHLLKGLGVLA